MSVWQQGNNNNFCHVVWMFWLTLCRSLHFFLALLLLSLNIICLLWMLPYDIFSCKTKKGLYLWEQLQNISFQQSEWFALWSVLQRYLSISCYDDVSFIFFLFYIAKTCSKWLMWSNNRIFYILFYFIANFNQVFTMF